MTWETTVRLSEIDNIVGIKEAGSDFDQIAHIIQETDHNFKVWSGNDNETFHIMNMGGHGIVSVASHLVGSQIKAMMGHILEGNVERAAELHLKLHPIFKVLFVIANPIPVKYAVNKAGFNVGETRLPLVAPDAKTAAELDSVLGEYHIDLPV